MVFQVYVNIFLIQNVFCIIYFVYHGEEMEHAL